MNDNEKILNEKAIYYATKEMAVHINCTDGKFYNGLIIDVNDVRIILLDEKLGETYISLKEVHDLEPREVKG